MSDRRRAAAARFASLLLLWLVLIGASAADLAVGGLTAAAATWVGLRVLPPQPLALRWLALPRLTLRFLRQSLLAGFDVARRALDPRLPLRPGFATYRVGIAAGPMRSAFIAETCLLPGTVAIGDDDGLLLYHCLDVAQPVAAQLADEEAALWRALRGTPP